MMPEKTKPMNRANVLGFLESLGIDVEMKHLHHAPSIAHIMATIGPVKRAYLFNCYDNVMGALLHFWKQTRNQDAKS